MLSTLKAMDLSAVYAERKKQTIEGKKFAAKQNAKIVPPPRTLSEIKTAGEVHPKRTKLKQHSKNRQSTNKKKITNKAKGSVWTISGGAFETNRRKH